MANECFQCALIWKEGSTSVYALLEKIVPCHSCDFFATITSSQRTRYTSRTTSIRSSHVLESPVATKTYPQYMQLVHLMDLHSPYNNVLTPKLETKFDW